MMSLLKIYRSNLMSGVSVPVELDKLKRCAGKHIKKLLLLKCFISSSRCALITTQTEPNLWFFVVIAVTHRLVPLLKYQINLIST